MKKPTAKYCSVRCCSVDPVRRERLRRQGARKSDRSMLPLSRQLRLQLNAASGDEAQLALLCEGREDVPGGLSRWAG
ncbi:MAG: hypothetical protein ABR541_06215 [Candidatus Dormibacteria bacterium]